MIFPNYPEQALLFEKFTARGRGEGLRAVRDIKRGTPILSEEALFSKVVGALINQNDAAHPEFQALACPSKLPTDLKRFEANSFQMGKTSTGQDRDGIFVRASRFNHSCIPNAYFAWNENSEHLTVHAIIDISSGDEILIDYCPRESFKKKDSRQRERRHYDFKCACPACRPKTNFRIKSDGRREKMRRLETETTNASHTPESLESSRELLKILHEEGLVYPQRADAYTSQAQWWENEMQCIRRGYQSDGYREYCREKALDAARKRLDLDVIGTGYESPVVEEALEVIERLISQ